MSRKLTTEEFVANAKEVSRAACVNFRVSGCFQFASGATALKLEAEVLKLLKASCKPVVGTFQGSTEVFLDVDNKWLIELIEEKSASNGSQSPASKGYL